MTLDQYLSRVLPYVSGCPNPIAEMAIRDSVDQFCRDTRVLQDYLEPMSVVAGQADVDVSPSIPGAVIHDVLFVRVGDTLLEQAEAHMLPEVTGIAYFYQTEQNTIRLHNPPKQDEVLTAGLVLTISPNTSNIPAKLDRWREGIAAGALMRLHGDGATWSNPSSAAMCRAIYAQEMAKAKAESTLGQGKRPLRSAGSFV